MVFDINLFAFLKYDTFLILLHFGLGLDPESGERYADPQSGSRSGELAFTVKQHHEQLLAVGTI